MATNITLLTSPVLWSSAYDDIEYVFNFDNLDISSASSISGGTITRITPSVSFAIIPPINSYCYIDSGIYLGLWKVLESTLTYVDLDLTYSANQTTGIVKSLRLPTFTLYKGFQVTENFPTQLPYTLVTSFTHTFNSSYQLAINLKGLLQKIFTIIEPDITSDFDYSVFNAFRLVWDVDQETEIKYVLNSSITTDELNDGYIENGAYLTNTSEPLLWACGISFMTKFIGGFPTLQVFNGGTQVVAGFSSAFQSDQFSQGYDI